MTPERFQRIEAVFERAADLGPTERAAFLETECEGDAELLEQVRSLLGAMPTAERRLESVVAGGAESMQTAAAEPGKQIGPYRILEAVAGGGMGSVYRAVRADGQYEKDVAIKLIRDAYALDDHFVRRFVEERQILARMEHPNIARLLDGGVTDDRVPYLAMEFIAGKPITAYCRNEPLETKLRLFQQVSGAVHYAHRNLVVHRDIKPGNILVTAEGEAKLLDFGVAKVMNSGRDLTATGSSMLTLDYASPEQLRGEPVTTASDIYSLGLLLYELLAGHKAYDLSDASPAEIMQRICEQDPPPPSTVGGGPGVAGDLDNIVLKAIRKAPSQRYGSAEQFADDIRRHLENQPIEARPATFRYLASKFVGRNRLAVAMSGAVAVALLLGGFLTWRQARIAERRFDLVRGLANSVVFEVDPALERLAGSTPVRRIVIDKASAYLDKLSLDSQGDQGLQSELAAAYEKLAGVKGNPNQANLGDLAGAIGDSETAVRIRRQLLAADPANAERRSLLAASKASLGILLAERGETSRGREMLQQALAECKGIELTSPDVAHRLGEGYIRLARLTSERTNKKASFDLFAESLRILSEASRRFPDRDFRPDMALAYANMARSRRESSELPLALEAAQKALDLRNAVLATASTPDSKRELLLAHQTMGDVLGAPGQFSLNRIEEGRAHYERSIAIAEELAAADPLSYRSQRDLMVSINRLADVVERQGDKTKAFDMYQRSLGIVEALVQRDRRPQLRLDLATSLARVGERFMRQGNKQQGLEYSRRSLDVRESPLLSKII